MRLFWLFRLLRLLRQWFLLSPCSGRMLPMAAPKKLDAVSPADRPALLSEFLLKLVPEIYAVLEQHVATQLAGPDEKSKAGALWLWNRYGPAMREEMARQLAWEQGGTLSRKNQEN
jgi:hypothetical protein